MPLLKRGELRELIARELPGALAPPTRALPLGNGGSRQQEVQDEAAETMAATSPAPADPDSAAAANPAAEDHRSEGGAAPALNDNDAVVVAERLPEVLRWLRDTQGYGLLSHITAVDYVHYGIIEVMYYLYNVETGGSEQIVRVRVPREHAVIPSIATWWPGANLQEREAWDLYGVEFPGHPYHHRIYMWEEFEGHPMRKDFPKVGDAYYHFKWKGEDGDEE